MLIVVDVGCVESIQPLIGISRWSMDLIAYLVDDLFQLARAVGDRVGDRGYIRSIGNTPFLLPGNPSIHPR